MGGMRSRRYIPGPVGSRPCVPGRVGSCPRGQMFPGRGVGAGSHPARSRGDHAQIAEESLALAFAGAPESAAWLGEAEAAALLDAAPDGNVAPEQARDAVARVVESVDLLRPRLDEVARERAAALLDAHRRVRESARLGGTSYRVEPQLPVDVLGVYVLLPVSAA